MIDVNRRYVVSKVRELFGQYCSEDANIESVLENQLCPYNNKKCFKTRKSDSETSIGTCTVNYQNRFSRALFQCCQENKCDWG